MERTVTHAILLGVMSSTAAFILLVFLTALPSVPGLSSLSPNLTGKLQVIFLFSITGIADMPLIDWAYLAIVSLVFGMNVALLYAHISRFGWTFRIAPGFTGALAAAAGAGCAACGTLLLAPLIATGVGTSLVAALPFAGAEIGWIGICLMLFSSLALARGVFRPYS